MARETAAQRAVKDREASEAIRAAGDALQAAIRTAEKRGLGVNYHISSCHRTFGAFRTYRNFATGRQDGIMDHNFPCVREG